ncbi:hypothetical protein Tco_0550990 [Tanacetum coccineum]
MPESDWGHWSNQIYVCHEMESLAQIGKVNSKSQIAVTSEIDGKIRKKKDSNSEISVVNEAGKREQKRGIGNDIEDEEVIELNNASGVIDTSIGLMGIRLMDCGFNGNGKLCGNTGDVGLDSCIMECVKECLIEIEPVTLGVGGLELRDECIVECLGGMEREICEKMRNSVKKNGSGVCEMEFIAGDIIREEGFEEDRKNGNNSLAI